MDDRKGNLYPYFYGLTDADYDHILKHFEDVIEHPTGFYLKYESGGENIALIATKTVHIKYTTATKCEMVFFNKGARETMKELFGTYTNIILPLHYEPKNFADKNKVKLDDGIKLKNEPSSHSQLLVVSEDSWKLYDCLNNCEQKKPSSNIFEVLFKSQIRKKLRGLGLNGVKRVQYVKFETQNPMYASCALLSLWVTQQILDNGMRGTFKDYGLQYLQFKDNVCAQVDKRGVNKAGGTMHMLQYWKKLEKEDMEE